MNNGASVSSFAVDGSGSVVALAGGQLVRFVPGRAGARPMPTSKSVSSFAVDGSGSVVALSGGQLLLFAPGPDSTTSTPLATTGDAGVSYFAVDGSGSVVALASGGLLIRFAPGSTASQGMNNGASVSSFVVDGSGSVVALDSGAESLVRFAPGSNQGQTLDGDHQGPGRVTALAVDGSGTVVVVDGSVSIPGQRDFGGSLAAFPAGSTGPQDRRPIEQSIEQSVQSFVIDASGSVVAVDSVVALEPAPGLQFLTLERFAPGLPSDAHGFVHSQYMNLANVSHLAVDASGSVVAQSGSALYRL
jgi:hypothetical protein